jgi:ribosomal protein S18 acetylase RimI-like enzyme
MHALDNVIWQALTTRQAHLAVSSASARRFCPEISPLAGLSAPSEAGYDSLGQLLPTGEIAALFLAEPYSPMKGWSLFRAAPLLQMVHENGVPPVTDHSQPYDFVQLGTADLPEMLALTKLTEPGPFNSRTHELGTYLGIRSAGSLVAMAGERLKVPGYTEVSAVCTHPDHIGRGYARSLMMEIMQCIRSRGEKPFLHVRRDNVRAIELYRKLGFRERMLGHLAVLRKE